MNNKIIAVAGPTASGKSGLAVGLAKIFGAQVISCDSMQIYKGMDIGTAKVTEEEMDKIKHHLIDFVDIGTDFSVSDYVEHAQKIITDLQNENILPIIAGGTGLYLRSLLYAVNFNDNSKDEKLRQALAEQAQNGEIEILWQKLKTLDPKSTEKIHINNQKRVIRALEYCLVTGEKFSEQSIISTAKYDFLLICLGVRDRQKLYDRINLRVDLMFKQGLIQEAKEYYQIYKSGSTCSQAIGYKELFPYFEGLISLDEATENIKRETRRYAKRQLTWFKKEQNVHWIYIDDFKNSEELLQEVITISTQFLKS
ncbi:MAG: tRNA (adenosine(37)-N6)-dimethylallyltransferase MiaA [Clostridia bacterium]